MGETGPGYLGVVPQSNVTGLVDALGGKLDASSRRLVGAKLGWIRPRIGIGAQRYAADFGVQALPRNDNYYCAFSSDTDHTLCSKTQHRALKLTSNGTYASFYVNHIPAAAIDVRNSVIYCRFYLPAPADLHDVSIWLLSSATADRVVFTHSIYTGGNRDTQYEAGWHVIQACIGDFVPAGSPNLAAITHAYVLFSIEGGARAGVVATVDCLEIWPQSTKKLYAFCADDGYAAAYPQAKYLAGLGLRGSFGIISGLVGTDGYLTLAQLRDMRAMGHCIYNHGWDPDKTAWLNMTLAEQKETVRAGAQWLIDNGFPEAAGLYVVPVAGYNYDTDPANFFGSYMDAMIGNEYNSFNQHNCLLDNRWLWYQYASSANYWAAGLTRVKTYGGLSIGFNHGADPLDVANADLKAHFDAVAADVAAGNVQMIGLDELYGM